MDVQLAQHDVRHGQMQGSTYGAVIPEDDDSLEGEKVGQADRDDCHQRACEYELLASGERSVAGGQTADERYLPLLKRLW